MRRLLFLSLGLAALSVAACAPPPPAQQTETRSSRWSVYQDRLLAQGLMRSETDPADAPWTAADLTRNFRRIAFDFEADPFATGRTTSKPRPRVLRRVTRGPSLRLVGGEAESRRLIPRLRAFNQVIRQETGLTPVFLSQDAQSGETRRPLVSFVVLEDRQWREIGRTGLPRTPDSKLPERFWTGLAQTIRDWHASGSPCGGTVWSATSDRLQGRVRGEIVTAIIFLRASLPDLLLTACVEEEYAQALGLVNDDPSVRPSLFNDDGEFARLTTHDRALLRLLYDRRLTTGMARADAMPIARRIAVELARRAGG
ncbi:MAG: DUF2927 domain-containing protein [Pseudomonadota bacterium]